MRASLQGMADALADPAAAVAACLELIRAGGNKNFLSDEGETFRWQVESKLVATARARCPIGVIDPALLQAEVDAYTAAGVFPTKPATEGTYAVDVAADAYGPDGQVIMPRSKRARRPLRFRLAPRGASSLALPSAPCCLAAMPFRHGRCAVRSGLAPKRRWRCTARSSLADDQRPGRKSSAGRHEGLDLGRVEAARHGARRSPPQRPRNWRVASMSCLSWATSASMPSNLRSLRRNSTKRTLARSP